MSPDPGPRSARLRAEMHASPSDARCADGEPDAALRRAVERSVAEARAEGAAEGERRACERAAAALDAACQRLDAAREQAAAETAGAAAQLAVEIARVLLRGEIEAGRYDLEGIVREALSFPGAGRGACVVHLNPHDAAALASVRFRAGTVIEPDEAVVRGDVHVSTPHGLLVRELDEALASIRERLLGECP